MARCLITGHKGYIGSHLYRALWAQGHEVMGIDLKEGSGRDIMSFNGLRENENWNVHEKGFHPHYENFKPEYVFHLACFPRVQYSVENPVETMKNNVLSTSIALNFARKVGAKRFIYSSSSSVIGNGDGPESPYALQKLTSEIETKLYSKLYDIDTVSLRYFNVYSPDQKADGPYATAVSAWMDAIRTGKRPFITGTGEQRRDMLHVEDAVSANIFAMNHENNFNGQSFDTGTGENISLNEIKDIINRHHPDVEFDYVDPRPGDVLETRANPAALKDLGWRTEIGIYQGVEECFKRLLK
tara:strand:+ start:309 stop:1205 length:897 start_codon:yes stop_codon:yes gene_type:complete